MATNSQRIAFGTVMQAINRVATAALGAFSIILSTRYLGLDGYGQLTAAIIYLSIFGTITDSEISTISVREIARGERSASEIIGNVLVLRTVMALVAVGIGVLIGFAIYHQPNQSLIREAIAWLSLTLIMGTIQNVLQSGLATKLRYDLIAIGDIIGKAAIVALIWASVANSWGFNGIVAAYVAGGGINLLIGMWFGLRDTIPSFKLDPKFIRYIVIVTLPLGIAALLNTLYYRADGVLLSVMSGNSEVGLYGVAYKIVELTMGFALMFQNSILPVFASAHRDLDRLAELHRKAVERTNVLAAPVMVGVIVLAPQLILLFGGRTFAAAAAPLAILMIGNYFIYSSSVYNATLISMNQQKQLVYTTSMSLVLNVALNLYAIPRFGVIGAATSVAITEAAILIMLRLFYRRLLGTEENYFKLVWPYLACAAVMGVAVYFAESLILDGLPLLINLMCATVLGIAVYGGALLLTGKFQMTEIKQLVKR